ncbi:MAG TPA: glycoside hydrolase family 32 protein [Planctomycetota bacterium]|nr:glycoside hydrolase family 32 protein [Planctomycetota bacterium]
MRLRARDRDDRPGRGDHLDGRPGSKDTMTDTAYDELLRPRFHFTAKRNWLNDPNGLVHCDGVWHLFFQHHADGLRWGPMTWGHAVSPDLVHWTQLEHALRPDDLGTMWSGSAVVDRRDTSGLRIGATPPLVAMYTAVRPDAPASATQCLAASTDGGATWTKHAGNPVIPCIEPGNRDPKVIWHEPTGRWVMALYLAGSAYALFASPDLKAWTRIQTITVPGTSECPDFFPLRIDGDASREQWVLWVADGVYVLGDFDGDRFTPRSERLVCELGPNGYAAQTWSDAPDGRRTQISWMRGGTYPWMPFNQQLSFPVDLTLRSTPEGPRLYRWPVREIGSLVARRTALDGATLSGRPLYPEPGDGLYDLEIEIDVGSATALHLRIHGRELRYQVAEGTLTLLERTARVPTEDGRLRLRLLIDRTSIEWFADGGRHSASFCFLADGCDEPLAVWSTGGDARIVRGEIRHLRSAWHPLPPAAKA